MEKTYPKLELADAFVCGTPLYWYGPSAKTKLLIDRLRPYISSGLLRGKKAVLVIPSEEGIEACRFAVGMFRLSFKYLGIKLEEIVLPEASERSEIKKKPHVLDEAFAVGKSLK
jgi:multimeric flavodoxin WrbA